MRPDQRPQWSAAEDDAIRSRYVAEGAAPLAGDLGRTVSAVHHRARRLRVLRSRRWSASDDRQLTMLWGDLTLRQIATALRRTPVTVYWRARKLGLKCGCPEGYEYLSKAAERTGYDSGQLRRILRAGGVQIRVAMSRERPGRHYHYVDPLEVDDAVAEWHRHETVADAAGRFGVCDDTVRRWLREARAAGIKVPPEPKRAKAHWRVPSELLDRLASEREGRMSIRAHEDRLGIGRGTLMKWLRAAGHAPTYVNNWRLPAAVVDAVVAKERERSNCRAGKRAAVQLAPRRVA